MRWVVSWWSSLLLGNLLYSGLGTPRLLGAHHQAPAVYQRSAPRGSSARPGASLLRRALRRTRISPSRLPTSYCTWSARRRPPPPPRLPPSRRSAPRPRPAGRPPARAAPAAPRRRPSGGCGRDTLTGQAQGAAASLRRPGAPQTGWPWRRSQSARRRWWARWSRCAAAGCWCAGRTAPKRCSGRTRRALAFLHLLMVPTQYMSAVCNLSCLPIPHRLSSGKGVIWRLGGDCLGRQAHYPRGILRPMQH